MDGSVGFDAVAFRVKQLNATYGLDNEKISLKGQQLVFDNFSLTDSVGRKLTTDGTVYA